MSDMKWLDDAETLEVLDKCECGRCQHFRKLIAAVRLAYKKASSARANVGSRKIVVEELEELRDRLRSGNVEEK